MREAERITGLPRIPEGFQVPDQTDAYRTEEGTQTLRPIQSEALFWLKRTGGLLGAISVGEGKTLIAFLASRALGLDRCVLLVPPGVYDQVTRMLIESRRHWMIRPIEIVSYSALSQASGTTMLDTLDPEVIVADECHLLKRMGSARTKRVIRFFQSRPECRFVALSGTVTARSIRDYAHLADLALRDGSPVPRDRYALLTWVKYIDADQEVQRGGGCAPSMCSFLSAERPGWQLGEEGATHHARGAFRERLRATPGVVVSREELVKASLRISLLHGIPYPADEYKRVQASGERPDGEVFEADVDEWRCLRQLSLGFYYRWDWGDREPDQTWIDARREWGRFVRAELERHACAGYDSPKLVSDRLHPDDPSPLAQAWNRWKAARERVGPDTVPVWIDDGVLQAAMARAEAEGDCLVWYESRAVAQRLAQLGFRVIFPGSPVPLVREGTLCLSIASHGTGLNLQHYSRNIVLEPPPGGHIWDQMIGRTHRAGQPEDTVLVSALGHTPVFQRAIQRARSDASYRKQTTGVNQRLLYADFNEVRA